MKNDINKKRSDISELSDISSYDFENIFSMYQQDGYYLYNIIKTVQIPDEIDSSVISYVSVTGQMSWARISYDIYGTIRLWWLICIVNKIMNPVKMPRPGQVLRVIRPEYISTIISLINEKL